ncbi:MAG TPA: cation:proton antiporter [Candidatus Mailhella excrementigallinarum]|nr:MAG: potassium transporter KefB [Desulfovibrionaceae bacterium]PWL64297.1 MAG: potassium transporter KefB [Desulfovibrionaceae bacterium]HIV65487.1 cation:proton antiporter [Candidatus Mailhella excrementigallinarum]
MDIPLLPDIARMFCLSLLVLLVCCRLRLPSIVGLLITGVLCGPTAFGLVENVKAVELLAETGVVMLMFTIGLEMSGAELSRLKKPVFLGGTAQVAATILIFLPVSLLSGHSASEGIFFGCIAALSSTAIVLSLYQQKAQSESPQGRLSLAVLIFQDLAIVPMMLLVPLLSGQQNAGAAELLLSGARTVAILGGGWILAKHVLPRLMLMIVRSRSRELLLIGTLGLCLAIAVGTAWLGLSLSLGAFMAGLLLAESEYSLSVVEGVLPFKMIFTSLFFISIGMLLDVDFAFTHVGPILLLALALLLFKTLAALAAMLLLRYPLRVCLMAAMSISQIGEFSFVLARSGVDAGLLDNLGYQVFLASSILTMVATPFMMGAAPAAAGKIASLFGGRGSRGEAEQAAESSGGAAGDMRDHLMIIGFGIGGKHLARTARKAGIPYVVLEMNPDTVSRYRDSEPIHHGDASDPMTLEHYGVKHARVLAVVISDSAAVRGVIDSAHRLNPGLNIVARTRFVSEEAELRRLGAQAVISEDFETSIEIFAQVLGYYLVPQQTITGFVREIRGEHYRMVRDLNLPGRNFSLEDARLSDHAVSALLVEPGSAAAGRSLMELDLRRLYDVTVVGILRGGRTLPSPGGEDRLEEGDTAYLFADAEKLGKAAALFSAEAAGADR